MKPSARKRLTFAMRLLAVALAALAVVIAAVYAIRSAHISYRIALVEHAATSKTVLTIGRTMAEQRSWMTLAPVEVPDFKAAADALQSDAADLAVLRPDVAVPSLARVILTLSRDPAFLIAPAKSPVESLRDLQGQSVGLVVNFPADQALFDHLLNYYSVPLDSIKRVPLTPAEAGGAVRQKKVAAVFVVGRTADPRASETFAGIARATRATPTIITFDQVETIPGLTSSTIPAGAFGGREPQPEEEETTIGVSYVLAARVDISNAAASELAERVIEAKEHSALIDPGVRAIEAPDPDDHGLPLHPGAKAYFADETTSPFDRFESLFWLGYVLIPVVGSVGVWLFSRITGGQETDTRSDALALAELLRDARTADRNELKAIQARLDEFVERSIERFARGQIESEEFAALSSAAAQARTAIADRSTGSPVDR